MMRVGVIGTGKIAGENLPALLRTGRARIAALCNRTPEKADALAQQLHLEAPVYADWRDMLRKETLDAVLIQTPHGQHAEQAVACAQRGLHLLIEKPLASTAAEGETILAACAQYGVRAAVCHTQRYLPPIMALRDFLRSPARDALGALKHIEDTLSFHYFHDRRPGWYFDPAQAGGGLLLTHGAHQIDRVHLLMGCETQSVCARVERDALGGRIDRGYQLLGVAGQVGYTVSCGGYELPHTSALRLTFEYGAACVSLFANGIEGVGTWVGVGEGAFAPLTMPYADADTYVRQFSAMLDALEGKPSDAPTLAEAQAVMRVLDAAVQSADTGAAQSV